MNWGAIRLNGFQHIAKARAHFQLAPLDANDRAQRELGDYELLEEIGRGGMVLSYAKSKQPRRSFKYCARQSKIALLNSPPLIAVALDFNTT
jgi:hypothetical protein